MYHGGTSERASLAPVTIGTHWTVVLGELRGAILPPLELAAATAAVPVARGTSAAQRHGERDDVQPVEGY